MADAEAAEAISNLEALMFARDPILPGLPPHADGADGLEAIQRMLGDGD